jgi:putative transposase
MNITKQAIHQFINRQLQYDEVEAYLFKIVADIRKDHPTMSCRAMYFKVNPINIGRDKFERLCTDWGLVTTQKRCYTRTTDSSGVVRFDNLSIGVVLNKANQMYSSDITYYEVNGIFYYITFILDCYTRRILGHSTSKRLTTEQTTMPALQMAIRTRGNKIPLGVIFHSDGGGQYYDKEFLKLTSKHKMRNSMCEYAWENGKAERINGVIKNNYLKHKKIKSFEQLVKNVDQSVTLYNNDKPHKALKYKSPIEFEKSCTFELEKQTLTMIESLDAKTDNHRANAL